MYCSVDGIYISAQMIKTDLWKLGVQLVKWEENAGNDVVLELQVKQYSGAMMRRWFRKRNGSSYVGATPENVTVAQMLSVIQ
ncbi:hypothetical protein M5K25_023559 [Dendrobium thyrsiflorum]|uniref:Uncharacterized protein n=1 Tax=Dendrobium thyrsiflorum TaxID=117978 RepID=A0ABD0UF92_DENTH